MDIIISSPPPHLSDTLRKRTGEEDDFAYACFHHKSPLAER
jgi:hypothetical protein